MGSPEKILFLNPKKNITVNKKSEDMKIEKREYPSETEAEYLKNKVIMTLKKIEEMWELDHCNVELRDHIHLLRYYLKRLL